MTGGAGDREPTSDTCEVWIARVPHGADHLSRLLGRAELDRRRRYRYGDDRDRFTAAAALLRVVAGRFAGLPAEAVTVERTCARCGAPHGRPHIAGHTAPPFDVSVSHSGRFVAVAACRARRVGVDIEAVRTDYADLLPAACTPGEAAHVHLPRDFATVWVRKESVLKATGEGLTTSPRDVEVSRPAAPPRVIRIAGAAARSWQLHDLSVDADHVGAVAISALRPVRVEVVAASDLLSALTADR